MVGEAQFSDIFSTKIINTTTWNTIINKIYSVYGIFPEDMFFIFIFFFFF